MTFKERSWLRYFLGSAGKYHWYHWFLVPTSFNTRISFNNSTSITMKFVRFWCAAYLCHLSSIYVICPLHMDDEEKPTTVGIAHMYYSMYSPIIALHDCRHYLSGAFRSPVKIETLHFRNGPCYWPNKTIQGGITPSPIPNTNPNFLHQTHQITQSTPPPPWQIKV